MRPFIKPISAICFAIIALTHLAEVHSRAWAKNVAPRPSSIIRVMTFNIRYNNPNDGQNAWPNRKQLVASMIRFHHADLVGLQEALKGQLDDLQSLLPEYSWCGVGRDDGRSRGEFSAIFYRKDRFDLLRSSTFWLSETPDVAGSKGWDAALPRIVTWAKFKDKQSSGEFFHFNTHFDHRGEQARQESARLLLSRIEAITAGSRAVVTGDFNANESSEPYRIMAGGGSQGVRPKRHFKDARYSSEQAHHGPSSSFNGFKALVPGQKIDHIFVGEGTKVLQHGILSDSWDGRWPSDHLPVLAEIDLFSKR